MELLTVTRHASVLLLSAEGACDLRGVIELDTVDVTVMSIRLHEQILGQVMHFN